MINDLLSNPNNYINNEHENICKDGTRVWVAWTNKAILDNYGEILEVICIGNDITSHKQMEMELQRDKKEFQYTLDGLQEFLIRIYTDFVVQLNNRASAEMYNVPSNFAGRHCYEVFWNTDRVCSDCPAKKAMQTKQKTTAVRHHPSGRIFDRTVYPTFDKSGEVNGATILALDATERKQAKEALQESERKLQTITNTAQVAIIMMDPQGKIAFWNPKAEDIFGYTSDEALGQDLHSLLAPKRHHEAFKARFPEFQRTGQGRSLGKTMELAAVRKNGEEFPMEESLSSVKFSDGWYAIGMILEITERKQAEEELRLNEKHLNLALEGGELGTWDWNYLTDEVHFNERWATMKGYEPDEIEPHLSSWSKLVHPEDFPQVKEKLNAHLAGKTSAYEAEFRMLNKSGNWQWILDKGKVIEYDFAGNPVRVCGTHLDITKQKQLEDKLKELSFHDSLTGLYNRNFFEEEMTRLSNGRYNPVGIVMCDVDGLKFANDTLGHEAGDQMLINTAEILRQNFRSSDLIARIGGDEFAILLTEIDSEILEQILQRVHQAVENYNATVSEVPLSLATGHTLSEGQATDMQALFRKADDRMYRDKIQHKKSARSTILQAITTSMQTRDFETEGHCERLQELAVSLGRSLDLSREAIGDLSLLGLFHDLGKMGISDHILFKSGPLTEEEWQQMRQHCQIGHRMASSVPELKRIADYILKHHERWDGQGYPLGLSGEDIPIPCRILAIVDAYDAMTSDRPYREAMSQEEAIAELRRCAGTQFDSELVEQFIQIFEQNDTE